MKKEMFVLATGYVPGSEGEEEDYSFDTIINDQIEQGAIPKWETYRIFTVDGIVFASVLIDVENAPEDWLGPKIIKLHK